MLQVLTPPGEDPNMLKQHSRLKFHLLPHKNAYFTHLWTEHFTTNTGSGFSCFTSADPDHLGHPPTTTATSARDARTKSRTHPHPARTFKNIHSFSFFTHPRAHKQRMLEVNPRPRSQPQRSEGKAQATAGILHRCCLVAPTSQPQANLQINPLLSSAVTL